MLLLGVKNSIVYLFGFSSWVDTKLESLLKIIKEQNETDLEINIILMHDGVIGTSKKGEVPKILAEVLSLPVNIFAILPDIKARGIDPKDLHNQIKPIEYDELVDILIDSQKIVSWI